MIRILQPAQAPLNMAYDSCGRVKLFAQTLLCALQNLGVFLEAFGHVTKHLA
jgi:hypothetical protein